MITAARFYNRAKKSRRSPEDQRQNSISQSSVISSHSNRSTPNSPRRLLANNTRLLSPSLQKTRSGSAPNIRHITANEWGLKSDQVLALKVTWSKLCEMPHSTCRGIGAIMEQVFNRLNEKNKEIREIFYNAAFVNSMAEFRQNHTIATLRDHSHFFISLISQVIQSFDTRHNEIFEHIRKIGSYHAGLQKYGFRQDLWDRLGEELIDALVVQDCVRSFPDACRAWTILIATLIDRLRAAAASSYACSKVTPIKRRSSCLTNNFYRISDQSLSPSHSQSCDEQMQKLQPYH